MKIGDWEQKGFGWHYCKEDNKVVRPQEEPEVVALGDQTVDEVKDLLKKAAADEQRKREETAKLFEDLDEEVEEIQIRYTYQDDLRDCETPDLSGARGHGFRKDVDVFAEWRKLADVHLGDEELQPEVLRSTKDLMDYIVLKLGKQFPKLEISWTEATWNPRLCINKCPTQISMEKLGLAYQGLMNITEDLKAQALLVDIISKKLKELFI